ncbi:MAG: flagellar hook-length control protein FliK [Planctomycetota bacterium]
MIKIPATYGPVQSNATRIESRVESSFRDVLDQLAATQDPEPAVAVAAPPPEPEPEPSDDPASSTGHEPGTDPTEPAAPGAQEAPPHEAEATEEGSARVVGADVTERTGEEPTASSNPTTGPEEEAPTHEAPHLEAGPADPTHVAPPVTAAANRQPDRGVDRPTTTAAPTTVQSSGGAQPTARNSGQLGSGATASQQQDARPSWLAADAPTDFTANVQRAPATLQPAAVAGPQTKWDGPLQPTTLGDGRGLTVGTDQRLAGAGPAKAKAAATPHRMDPRLVATAEQARMSVFRQIAMRLAPEGGELRVLLDPPELGELDLRMVVESSGALRLSIVAERPEMSSMIERHMNELRQHLADQGLSVSDSTVQSREQSQKDGDSQDWPSAFDQPDSGQAEDTATSQRTTVITGDGLDFLV